MAKILYETEYKKTGRFSFGRNWRDFLDSLNERRVRTAQDSLAAFLGGKNSVQGKTFVDIGCGSGLFSLAAHRMQAARVVSIDVDDESVDCVRILKEREGNPENWEIREGSALNRPLMEELGQFDIVYSWGVLHHTGDMKQAIKNVTTLVKPGGKLYIAIYNNHSGFLHGTSAFWLKVKARYNRSRSLTKRFYFGLYAAYLFLGLCLSLKNPFRYIKEYEQTRGMSWKHDINDWLGGFPYEFARPAEIINYLSDQSFTLQKSITARTIGCNEYVFVRRKPVNQLPEVTVLISVHNSARTLDKSLQSVCDQTLLPKVVCINDASTDTTAAVLAKWRRKLGRRLTILTNETNLGLTKSLNRGLARITTPYTARIDADDWWEPTKLEMQVAFLEANPDYGLIGCWYTNHRRHVAYTLTPPMNDDQIRQTIIKRNPFAHSCVLFRTQLVQGVGGYDAKVRYGQDYDLWLRCLPQTKLFNWPKNLCHRSVTGGISIEKQKDQMRQAVKTQLKYIHKYHLPLYSYNYVIEPWLISLAPRWMADIKRKLNDR